MLKAVYLPSYLSLRIPFYLILTLHEPSVLFRLPYYTYILVLWIYITFLVCFAKRRKIAFLGFYLRRILSCVTRLSYALRLRAKTYSLKPYAPNEEPCPGLKTSALDDSKTTA